MRLNHTPGAPAPAPATLHAWSAPVFATLDIPPPGLVLGPVLARGCITLVTGPRGVGKSWLALAMAHAAAGGTALADWQAPRACRVVYIDAAMGQGLLQARLRALAGAAPSPNLVLVPGDAQAAGLPDPADAAGRTALDRLATDTDLVVLDGLSALVRAGRGNGARWAALADWLRELRRRGLAVLLADAAEPRALAVLADTVLRVERPADGAAGEDLRLQVRLAAARTKEEPAGRRFELRVGFGAEGAAWTRLGDADHRALLAWRLDEDGYSSRQIARRLEVSPATAWRLVKYGRTLPAELRQAAGLAVPEPPRKPRIDIRALLAARWGGGAAADEEQEREAARTDPHPPPSPASGRRGPSHDSEPSPACGRGQGEGLAAAAMPEEAGAETANSREAAKHPPATLDEVATDDLLAVFLARRRWWKIEQPPPPDWLALFDYQTILYALRSRLTMRRLNKLMLDDDRLPYPMRMPSVISPTSSQTSECLPRA